MSTTVMLKPVADLTDEESAERARLGAAVYPNGPDNDREWAPRQWSVFVRQDDLLVSVTGALIREATANGKPVAIGGIGGVATHPDHRGKGYAPLGMARALDFLLERGADFALLVCRDGLVAYYETLGWKHFAGTLFDTQHGESEEFIFNEVMVGDLNSAAPTEGVIDIKGPAW